MSTAIDRPENKTTSDNSVTGESDPVVVAKGFRLVENKAAQSADMYIYDDIGPAWAGMVSAKGVVQALAGLGEVKTINVRINSPGGDVFEGLGIYNALKANGAKIVVHIDGMAFSAASFIAMVGDEINIAENGMMMVHEGSAMVWGKSKDMTDMAGILDQINSQIVGTYVSRTGRDTAEVAKMVADETWMTAAEALDNKFVTKITPNKAVSASANATKFAKFTNKIPDWVAATMLVTSNHVIDKPKESLIVTEPVIAPAVTTPVVANSTATPTPAASTAVATPAAPVTAPAVTALESAVANAPGVTINMAAPVAPAAPVTPPVDVVAIQNAAKLAERTRSAEIRAICKMAGCPDSADEFIALDNVTPQDVRNRMFDVLCSKNPPVGPNGHGAASGAEAPSADAKYKAEYEANIAVHNQLGTTFEQFVAVRKEQDAKK